MEDMNELVKPVVLLVLIIGVLVDTVKAHQDLIGVYHVQHVEEMEE